MNKFLFYASARWFGEACLELCVTRTTPQGKKQIYLIPRPDDDPFYPGMLHLPGVRKIPNEMEPGQLRRLQGELPFRLSNYKLTYLASGTYKAKRGTEYADIRGVVVPYKSTDTDFYDMDRIPRNVIEHHKEIIKMVRNIK